MTERHTPLNILLWSLVPHKTSCEEKRKKASLQAHAGETVLVFHTDSDAIRSAFKLQKACDYLFFYMKEPGSPKLLFVELKGTDVKRAAEQIKETILKVKPVLHAVWNELSDSDNLRAVVVSQGGTPSEQQRKIQHEFRKEVGIPLRIATGTADLKLFL